MDGPDRSNTMNTLTQEILKIINLMVMAKLRNLMEKIILEISKMENIMAKALLLISKGKKNQVCFSMEDTLLLV